VIKVTGDFSAVNAFRRKLFALGKTSRSALRELEGIAVQELNKTFSKGQNPYGRRWRPRKTARSNPILNETGALKGSASAQSRGATSFGVKYTDFKARYHHNGTRNIAARRLLPASGRLPSRWKKRFQVVFKRRFREAMR